MAAESIGPEAETSPPRVRGPDNPFPSGVGAGLIRSAFRRATVYLILAAFLELAGRVAKEILGEPLISAPILSLLAVLFLAAALFTVISQIQIIPTIRRLAYLGVGALLAFRILRLLRRVVLVSGYPLYNTDSAWSASIEAVLLVIGYSAFVYTLFVALNQMIDAQNQSREESLKLAHEIEERKKGEDERMRLQERIQRAQQLEGLERLAGGVAHSFNNILQGIIGTTGIMKGETPPDSPLVHSIDQIEREAWRATALTKEMLAFSGKGLFAVKRLGLSELVESMTPLIQTVISKTTELVCETCSGLPPIQGDSAQIRQVVLNLVTNASEALGNAEGRVTLSTSLQTSGAENPLVDCMGETLPPGTYVILSVSDTGSGMDEVTIKKIFDPFFTTRFLGRGLGLPAIRGIVRAHKGGIQVESKPGKGTTLRVFFPTAPLGSMEPSTSETLPREVPAPGTILVVDDEELVRATARRILEPQGYRVLEAVDGTAAVEILKADPERIQAVLLDLTMRGMDGVETLREMTQIRSDLKVVLTSGYSEREVRQQLQDTPVAGFIQKPYPPKDLVRCIERAQTYAGV